MTAREGTSAPGSGCTGSTGTPPAPPVEHGRRVSAMFGRIAGWYDLLNRSLSLGQDVIWRRRLVEALEPAPGGTVLDLAAGTLDVSLEILRRQPGSRVLAMDFSEPMLRRGMPKVPAQLSGRIAPVLADGLRLPLPTASVDGATIAFGIRNILPRPQALAELRRVIRPGGRLCILEFGSGKSRIWRGIYNLYPERILPAAGRLVSGDSQAYRYLADTIREFPTAAELAQELHEAGFAQVSWTPLLSGIVYIHVGRVANS